MYATLERMQARFGVRELVQLTDTEEPYTNTINLIKLQAAMDAANSEVNGYVMSRYGATVQNPTDFLILLACDLARYHGAVAGSRVTERDEVRYKASIKSLEHIAAGKLSVGTTPQGASPPTTSSNSVVMQSGRRSDFGKGGF